MQHSTPSETQAFGHSGAAHELLNTGLLGRQAR
ncbi:hypothetical protein SAMN06265337_3024 [Hymenobacter gelipurpurascens]|uniref:Uncharacterized protein n=1 Tax=Hymenobacter gelipurpurascens TaxID=89968 RepID=A0A212UBX2_9BACT|nr:hypothetical protein SAMN06265337_3024 [Hymenobacter gelipurpurascens]